MSPSQLSVIVNPPSNNLCKTYGKSFTEWKHGDQFPKRRRTMTRYVKNWTDEEEEFLLWQRRCKMPYKHIAMYLRKTELACRLHYHQMNSAKTRHGSSSLIFPCPSNHVGCDSCGKPVAPNQARESLGRPSQSSSLLPSPTPKLSPESSSKSEVSFSLMTPKSPEPAEQDKLVGETLDFTRLHHVYADHRNDIWTFLAEKYSTNVRVSPSDLEEAFFNTKPTHRDGSPLMGCMASLPIDSSNIESDQRGASTTSSTPPPNRCTVSAMLNPTDELSCREMNLNCF